jgi:hypothetical protein
MSDADISIRALAAVHASTHPVEQDGTAELMRHTLLVRKYDLDEITKTITDYIDQCEGNDWMEIAQKLSRVFAWEYEDYQP